jgi:endonuclease/exonuclease/phosphatase (EEP) superfamily protein YafD
MLAPRRASLIARLALSLLAAATLFGFAGALWWAFDLFSHFRAQYVVAALLLALLHGAIRQYRWVLPALALAAANAVPVVPIFLTPAEPMAPASARSLELMSFNLFGFNRQYARMLDYVRHEQPDVLVLIEVTPQWMPSVRQLAGDYPYHWINAGDDATGIAVLSRTAPSRASALELAHNGVPSYLLTFE